MSIITALTPRESFSDQDTDALRELKEAVYPPGGDAWEGASREWTSPQWGVFVRGEVSLLP